MGAETDLILRTAPLIMLVALLTGTVGAFSVSPSSISRSGMPKLNQNHAAASRKVGQSKDTMRRISISGALQMAADDDNQSQEDKLAALGYSQSEISRSKSKGDDTTPAPGEQEVFVEEFEVDAATLTAVGFGLIAFNFLVLANMGDGGIGGFVASIINSNRY